MRRPKSKKPAKKSAKPRPPKAEINTLELVSVGFPVGLRARDVREWSVAQFLRWRREARQAEASELVQVVPAVAGQIPGVAQRRPLPPAKPHRGGAPSKPRAFSDQALRAAVDARTTAGQSLSPKMQTELAHEFRVTLRTIQRRLKTLLK